MYSGIPEILRCEDLMYKIQCLIGTPADTQILFYQGRVIRDRSQEGNSTLGAYGIKNGQKIGVFSMVVNIKRQEGQSFNVCCNNTDTVGTLKWRIRGMVSIQMPLLVKGMGGTRGRVLSNLEPLFFHNMKSGDTTTLWDLQSGRSMQKCFLQLKALKEATHNMAFFDGFARYRCFGCLRTRLASQTRGLVWTG